MPIASWSAALFETSDRTLTTEEIDMKLIAALCMASLPAMALAAGTFSLPSAEIAEAADFAPERRRQGRAGRATAV